MNWRSREIIWLVGIVGSTLAMTGPYVRVAWYTAMIVVVMGLMAGPIRQTFGARGSWLIWIGIGAFHSVLTLASVTSHNFLPDYSRELTAVSEAVDLLALDDGNLSASQKQLASQVSWRVRILDYLKVPTKFRDFRREHAWNHPENLNLLSDIPPYYAPAWNTSRLVDRSQLGLTNLVQIQGEDWGSTQSGNPPLVFAPFAGVPWTSPQDLSLDQLLDLVRDRDTFQRYALRRQSTWTHEDFVPLITAVGNTIRLGPDETMTAERLQQILQGSSSVDQPDAVRPVVRWDRIVTLCVMIASFVGLARTKSA